MSTDERQTRRRYSDEEIAEALTVLQVNDGNVRSTSAQLGIPASTLQYWQEGKTPAISADKIRELRTKNSAGLAEAFELLAWRCLESITKRKLDAASLKDTTIAAAISTDKRQLLRGEPTHIHAHDEAKKTVDRIVRETGITPERAREIVAEQLGISQDELMHFDEEIDEKQ